MILPDVNILVYAHRPESANHVAIRDWLTAHVNGARTFGMAELALSGFLRLVTYSRIYKTPTPTSVAFDFCNRILASPRCTIIRPGPSHWTRFEELCRVTKATGKLVPDAYFAALAIESGCEWITADRYYACFPGLTWRHPLAAHATTNPL